MYSTLDHLLPRVRDTLRPTLALRQRRFGDGVAGSEASEFLDGRDQVEVARVRPPVDVDDVDRPPDGTGEEHGVGGVQVVDAGRGRGSTPAVFGGALEQALLRRAGEDSGAAQRRRVHGVAEYPHD